MRKTHRIDPKKKLVTGVFLVFIIIIAIVLYFVLISMRKNQPWQFVRVLTMQEREYVTRKYGSKAAVYRYVVVNPVRARICGNIVTVPKGFLSDGITPVGFDEYGETEWICHDYYYSTHKADNGTCISKEEADNILTLPTRRIAVKLWGQKNWDEGVKIGPQFLD